MNSKVSISRHSKYFHILRSTNLMLLVCFLMFGIIQQGCIKNQTLPDPLKAGWNNQPVCEVLEDNAKLRVLRCTFPPGVGHEKHYHDAHFGYTVAGSRFSIRDTTGTREVDVPTGSSFSNDGIIWHEVLNIGDSTGVFLIVEPK